VLSRAVALTAVIALFGPALVVSRPPARAPLPGRMLWAWERPVDLRGLPSDTGVAFLAQTVTITPASHLIVRRRQPLFVDPSTPVVAVTRIEAPADGPPDLKPIAAGIAATIHLPHVTGIQIDFDARSSQRAMYRRLLHDVRAALPPHTPLAMTALASWCLDDNWLDELPVDEVIPMLFQMGAASEAIRQAWPARSPAPRCRDAIGVSLGEPVVPGRKGRRTYVFNPGPWTTATVTTAIDTTKQ